MMKKVKAIITVAVLGSVVAFGLSHVSSNTDQQAIIKVAESAIFG